MILINLEFIIIRLVEKIIEISIIFMMKWMIVVFYLSHQDGNSSSSMSTWVAKHFAKDNCIKTGIRFCNTKI